MKRNLTPIKIFFLTILSVNLIIAGNPDRQGEAGAYELLINPWAKGSSLYNLNVSRVKGSEASFINPAGFGRIKNQEVLIGHTRWLSPSGITVNAFGYTTKIKSSGALSVSLMSLDLGSIKVTTTAAPEGTGATYKPSFFNIGVGYSHNFTDKVSVGLMVRGISEAIADLNAFGFSIDGGVQYAAGSENQFKLGIALRNIGSPMRFSGEGLSTQLPSPKTHPLTYDVRLSGFELPSLLHLGLSYDIRLGDYIQTTPMASFTANSFGKDLLGVGVETEINKMFSLRFAYSGTLGSGTEDTKGAYLGFAMGFGLEYPLNKKGNSVLMLDYGYRPTNPFQGTHNIGVGLSF
ncbi:MAG: PorV/PorQ family protein [Saprospiraceae bacterium]|nr:PorV/PorQ family protein [Saprospiraceae bacterium]